MMNRRNDNIDPVEIAKFEAQANKWWDRKGEFKALHEINPVRLAYIRDRCDLSGKQVLDVGCGGGLLAEAMAGQGARVTGIDMVKEALAVAKAHGLQNGHAIDYQWSTAENWARDHQAQYDIVTCMELIEHVPRPAELIRACSVLARPGGALFIGTVNRTWLSRLLIIGLSEYVLGIVRKGTHEYGKFVHPHQLARWARQAGLEQADLSGLRYLPFVGYASLCRSTSMNYLMHFHRR
ncbi:MAG: bifunctional 2-polyprenyl-6-hydroxyphenol methylase/3-demethylubiquinol 3-O-methyltransferase UbiG [Desulfobacteraceae bacterium]|jgi:2-polyprenyl-6-hydroxyphenyl methylase/3-demethylubiquinone-9 3-methyltransferase